MNVKNKNTSFADIISMMKDKGSETGSNTSYFIDEWSLSKEAKVLAENKKLDILRAVDKNWKSNIRNRMETDIDMQVKQALDGAEHRWAERKKKHKRIKNMQLMKLSTLRRMQQEQEKSNEGRGFKYIDANVESRVGTQNRFGISGFDSGSKGGLSAFNPNIPPGYVNNMRGRLDPSLLDTGSMINFFNLSKHTGNTSLKALLPGMNVSTYNGVNLPNYGANRRCFQMYSKSGLENVLNSRSKKGKLSYVGQGSYVDKRGIVISKHGPFWPTGYGPVCQCPAFAQTCPERENLNRVQTPQEKFRENTQQTTTMSNSLTSDLPWQPRNNSEKKPLSHHNQKQSNQINHHNSNNNNRNNNLITEGKPTWRGKPVIYDSERASRTPLPHAVPESMCESLVFESRFESGNLRQVRRIGEFDYELVLRTDLYTKRHTQWFYFRMQKVRRNTTYKLTIINLLKRDSLYNHGMKPIVYSELMATQEGLGWHRMGENIRYAPWHNPTRNGLLSVDLQYHSLEFDLTFDWDGVENDTIYVAHCYPYTYTDLKTHLDGVMLDEARSKHVKREVLCETTAGNACFLLTITEFPDKEKDKYKDFHEQKKGVVLTARVHPGETQASWMMKGAIDFLTSDDQVARELRKKFIFKELSELDKSFPKAISKQSDVFCTFFNGCIVGPMVVPMINPDGVIVGNYRTSLTARDLNRNYRHPRQVSFPTIWHTKQMVEHFSKDHEIVLYCDMHGHSRKPLVFMYGCERKALYKGDPSERCSRDCAKDFIEERLFPWLMSQTTPQRFSFHSSKYAVRRCKEATGRVVMFRQMQIMNSFTMEATFSGTVNKEGGIGRHFNINDFESVGRNLCETVLQYDKVVNDPVLKGRAVMDITKEVAKHMMANQRLLSNNVALSNKTNDGSTGASGDNEEKITNGVQPVNGIKPTLSQARKNGIQRPMPQRHQNGVGGAHGTDDMPPNKMVEVNSADKLANEYNNAALTRLSVGKSDDMIVMNEPETEENADDSCYRLLEQLHLHEMKIESDTSSDSDSESDPELSADATPPIRPKKKKRRKKRPNYMKSISAPSGVLRKQAQLKEELSKPKTTYPGFVNRYANRSNGGIPIYAQERVQERAARRLKELRVREEDKIRRREMFRQQLMMGEVAIDANVSSSDKEENMKPVYGEIYGLRYHLGRQQPKYSTFPRKHDPIATIFDEDELDNNKYHDEGPLNSDRDNEVLKRLMSESPERNNIHRAAEVSFCNLTFKPNRSPTSRASTASTLTSSDGGLFSNHHKRNKRITLGTNNTTSTTDYNVKPIIRPSTQGALMHYNHNDQNELNSNENSTKTSPSNGLVYAVHKVNVVEPKIKSELKWTSQSNEVLRMKPVSATVVNGKIRTKKFDAEFNINSAI